MGFMFILSIIMLTAEFTRSEGDTLHHGIVHSPITLKCPSPTTDIETVKWKINASDIPFLTFYPKDNAVDPENYDQRFSFEHQTDLHISALRMADSGRYECNIVSPIFTEEFTSVFHLSVTGGCFMPNYSQPLLTSKDCLPLSYINYATRCNFGCEIGFQLEGNQTVLCLANGLFDASIPHCKEVDICTFPPLHRHLLSLSHGCSPGKTIALDTNCSFTCEAGYIIKGREILKCSENGHFDGAIPTCEEIRCYMNKSHALPPGMMGDCLNDETVPINSSCSFTCEKDYTLNGSDIVTCMADGQFDGIFPTCEEVKTDAKQVNLVPLVALIVPVLIALVITAIYVYKNHRGSKAHLEREGDEQHKFIKKTINTEKETKASDSSKNQKVKFQNEVFELRLLQPADKHSSNLSFDRQRRHLRDLFRGYRQLLIRQLENENRVDMLKRLHEIEVNFVLPSLSSQDHFDAVKNKIPLVSKNFQTKELSQKEAFAWYVVVMLSFILDIKMADDVKSEIIGMTGQQSSSTPACPETACSARSSDFVPSTSDIPQVTKQYIDVVNKAFAVVINTESFHLNDEKELSNRTSKVAREMRSYLKVHGRKEEENESSAHTQSTSQSQEDTEDKKYFGKLCVRQVNQCASVYDQVDMRYQILRSFLTNSGAVQGSVSSKIGSSSGMDRIIEQHENEPALCKENV